MAGIFGCNLRNGEAAPIIHDALKRMTHLDHDSAGLATVYHNEIQVRKDAGKIDEVHERHNLNGARGQIGIGHLRWATHGAPVYQVNAHPQLDCHKSVAIVHNGVIENYEELKAELIAKGHEFRSKTDSEVIAHLIEEAIENGLDLPEALAESLKRIKGSYAIAAISTKEPEILVCARNESPLMLGFSEDATYCASHQAMLVNRTEKIIELWSGELAILRKDSLEIRKIRDMTPVKREPIPLKLTLEEARREGYPHYILMEICKQPVYLINTLRLQQKYLELMATFLDKAGEVFFVASGSSYNACLAASYTFTNLAYLATHPVLASEFVERYGDAVDINSAVLAISETGEDRDILAAVDHARFRAATILSLTNVIGSTLTRISRLYVSQQSGPFLTQTKAGSMRTFTAQTLVLTQVAFQVAEMRGKLSHTEAEELQKGLKQIPKLMAEIIEGQREKIMQIAEKYRDSRTFFVLGRGASSATAREGCLKLLELARVAAIAYPAGESKHGPISLVEEGFPVIFLCPKDETHETILGNIEEMKARGAKIIAIAERGDEEVANMADDLIEMPKKIHPSLTPPLYAIPLQLLAYYSATARGVNPDGC